jgi:thymidylate synthase (FAD)
MKIIEPSVKIYKDKPALDIYKSIERAARVCYRSEEKITDTSYDSFLRGILKRGHEAVIEHCSITAKIICDRGVTHELVRHRLASYCQESTRYVNYKEGIEVILPPLDAVSYDIWVTTMRSCEVAYRKMIEAGMKPQIARGVLPNSLKTEIVVTMNIRQWRHFFKLRCAPAAHPQMKQVADMLLKEMKEYIPVFYEDIIF